jgi:hypothetical protein
VLVRAGLAILGAPHGARGPARLDSGDFPVDDDGSQAEHGTFAASRSVDPAHVPAAQRAWLGRTLLLGGPGIRCVGTVKELRVTGEIYGLLDLDIDTDTEAGLAAGVLEHGRPVLAGVIEAPCLVGAVWAVPAGSLAPAAPGPGVTLEVHGDGCTTPSYRLSAGGKTLIAGDRPIAVRDTIDVDHDGWPEVVLEDGWLRRDARTGRYRREVVVHIPEDWYACIE